MEIWHNIFCSENDTMDFGILLFRFTFVGIIVTVGAYYYYCLRWKSKSISFKPIPGPWNLPIIGSLHHIGFNTHKAFQTMRSKFGNVFRVFIGSKEVIVVSGLQTIKEALITNTTTFAGRPNMYTFQFLSEGKSLSFSTYNETFKQHKRLAERAISGIMNKGDFVDNVVRREAITLVKDLKSLSNRPIDPLEHILWSIGHVMYQMCFGDSRAEPKDFQLLIKETIRLINLHDPGNIGNYLNFFPWSRRFITWKRNDIEDLCNGICSLVKQKEHEHFQTYNPGKIRNGLDALILACNKSSNEVDYDRILHSSQDFIGAGLDITYITLTWCVLYLAEYPVIQEKVRTEILSNIGKDRSPMEVDVQALNYTFSFLNEVIRHSSVVPFALPHTNLEDATLSGYFIPKNTFIMVDLHSMHKDPELWESPETFKPERFINNEGKLDSSVLDNFIPYCIGRRRCIGHKLSKQILYLYTAVLLQSFTIIKPDYVKKYDFTPKSGLMLRPKPFQVIFKEINS